MEEENKTIELSAQRFRLFTLKYLLVSIYT